MLKVVLQARIHLFWAQIQSGIRLSEFCVGAFCSGIGTALFRWRHGSAERDIP